MLVQIPSVSDVPEGKSFYRVFDIYLDGYYHCSLRYSLLLNFNTELAQNFDVTSLDEFPPKRLSISQGQLKQRRTLLQRYLHSVCHDVMISKSALFIEFWLGAQQASSDVVSQPVSLDVFLLNGKKVTVSVSSFDPSDAVLEKAAEVIGVEKPHTYYFGLYLEMKREEEDTWTVLRELGEHEAPYLSITTANKSCLHRITIRRSFWEPAYIKELLSDRAAMNLLYLETLLEVEGGEWQVEAKTLEKLMSLKKSGLKKEFLDLARTITGCAYRKIDDLKFDHPKPNTNGDVRVGRLEIVTCAVAAAAAASANDPKTEDQHYPLTRIRCWKVGCELATGKYWLAFHYQASASDIKWVTLSGQGVLFISQCLISAVNELVRIRKHDDVRTPGDQPLVRKGKVLPRVKLASDVPPIPPVPVHMPMSPAGSIDKNEEDETGEQDTAEPNGETGQDDSCVARSASDGAAHDTSGSQASAAPQEVKVVQPARSANKKKKVAGQVENVTFDYGSDDDL